MQNMRIGMLGSNEPCGVNPMRPERCPSWKTQIMAPNITARDSPLSTVALIGAITLPVMRNRITKVMRTMRPITSGSRSSRASRKSVRSAG